MSESAGDLSGLASVIGSIASDPEMMNRLRAAFSQGQGTARHDGDETGAEPDDAIRKSPGKLVFDPGASDRRRLIEALKPFLSAERREKADALINILTLLESGLVKAASGKGE